MVFMPNHTVIHCCLFICFSAGRTCEAKFLHEQLIQLGVKPEDSATATLIVQYGQEQKLHQAEELFESASTPFPIGGPVYNAMVDALCKCGNIEETYHLFMNMADQGHSRDVVTISILVTHLTKHGNFFSTANPSLRPQQLSASSASLSRLDGVIARCFPCCIGSSCSYFPCPGICRTGCFPHCKPKVV